MTGKDLCFFSRNGLGMLQEGCGCSAPCKWILWTPLFSIPVHHREPQWWAPTRKLARNNVIFLCSKFCLLSFRSSFLYNSVSFFFTRKMQFEVALTARSSPNWKTKKQRDAVHLGYFDAVPTWQRDFNAVSVSLSLSLFLCLSVCLSLSFFLFCSSESFLQNSIQRTDSWCWLQGNSQLGNSQMNVQQECALGDQICPKRVLQGMRNRFETSTEHSVWRKTYWDPASWTYIFGQDVHLWQWMAHTEWILCLDFIQFSSQWRVWDLRLALRNLALSTEIQDNSRWCSKWTENTFSSPGKIVAHTQRTHVVSSVQFLLLCWPLSHPSFLT